MDNTRHKQAPEIAILGHPNEGKSSVLSTLAEDDSVRISDTPGETTECRTFPVVIDGKEVLRFTDTPGFQDPLRVLAELRKLAKEQGDVVSRFRELYKDADELRDDIELLIPVERGAGIIYVVDGSRPVRNVDRAEMEILRLTGRPRMAIINCKDDDFSQLDAWKNEFRLNFNSNRVFNAHRATYAERISLLEALKSIDQDWQPTLNTVVKAFKNDWAARNEATIHILMELFDECLQYKVWATIDEKEQRDQLRSQLASSYCKTIEAKEKKAHQEIRALFKHNIFNLELPPHSILHEDLFSETTWHLLGLSKKQITIIGGISGATLGAGLDLATGGLSHGVFTGLGGAIGALGALFGGESISAEGDFLGLKLGGEQLRLGPANNINLLFILINRALLFYQHTINWAHGRRDYEAAEKLLAKQSGAGGYTANWPTSNLRMANGYFKAITEGKEQTTADHREKLSKLLSDSLSEISRME